METTEGVVSIQEAANRLGITEDGVKKRIKRGRLKAQRINDALYVFVSELDGQAADKQRDTKISQKVSQQRRQDKQNNLVSALEEDVVYLKQQITIKDQQLAEKDQQLKELLQVQERVIELAEPQAEEAEPRERKPDGNRNPLVRLWCWFVGK